MTDHTNIRFTEEQIAEVRAVAAGDGRTVSDWIRHRVDDELVRRSQPTDERARLGRIMTAFAPEVLHARDVAPGSGWATKLQNAYDDLVAMQEAAPTPGRSER